MIGRKKKGAKDALQATAEQVKQLFDASPVAMAVTSGETDRIEAVNVKFTELFGYTAQDVVDAERWWPLAYPDEKYREEIRSLWEARVAQARQENRSLEPVEAMVTCKDGSRRFVEFRLSFVGEGKLVSFVDLTRRKQAEEKLEERERHSQSLLRLSKNLERAETHADALRAARDEVKEIIGYQNLWVYLLTEDKQSFKVLIAGGLAVETAISEDRIATLPIQGDKMLEEIAAANEIVVVEDARTDPRTNKDIVAQVGNRTIVNVPIILMGRRLGSMGTGTFGEEGVRLPSPEEQEYLRALASHLAVTLDRLHLLSERQRAETELRESRRRYRDIFDNVVDSLFLLEVTEDGHFRNLELNPAIEQSTGIPREQMVGKLIEEVVPPDVAAVVNAKYQRSVEAGHITEEEVELNLPTGKRYYHSTLIPKKDETGRVSLLIGISRDITDRRQVVHALHERERHSQSLLRLSRKLEQAQTYAEALDAAQAEVKEIIGYQNLWAYLLTPDQKYAKALMAQGPMSDRVMAETGTGTIRIQGDRMMEEFLATTEILVVEDAQTDERTNKEIAARMGNRTLVHVPIFLFDRHLGSVGMGTFGEEGVRVPTASEREYLIALASHLAVTFDRLRLLAEQKHAEKERLDHLRFFESMDRVNRAIQGTQDLEQMMRDVLDVLLDIFQCDRSWLVYPCDPEAATWQPRMERTRPEYPGLFGVEQELPLTPTGSEVFRALRAADGPVKFGPGEEHAVDPLMRDVFSVQSYMAMALYPNIGKPWAFGLHQCSYARVWTAEDERLFQGIGRRVSDALTNLLVHQQLQQSEERYRMLFDVMDQGVAINELVRDERGDVVDYKILEVNPAFTKNSVFTQEQVVGKLATALYQMTPEFIRDWWRRHSEMQQVVHTEMYHAATDRWFQIATTPLQADRFVTFSMDITARKKAEANLRASEQLFRALVENAPDHIARYDREFRRIYVNPAIQKLFSHWPAQIIGNTPAEQSPVHAPQTYIAELSRVIETGTESVIEMPYRTPEGEMRWSQMRFVPEFGADGEVESVLAIGRDIHEIKENERRFRTLAENFPDFVLRLDREGHLLYVNPAFEKAMEMPAESMVGKTIWELPAARSQRRDELSLALIERAFREGVANESEVHWDTETGERIFDLRNVPEKDATGNVVTVLCIARDVTERKRAEIELRASEARFRMLVEQATDAFFLADEQGRVLDVNVQACVSLGYSREELVGMVAQDYDFNVNATPAFLAPIRAKMAAGEVVEFESMHRRKDGTVFPVEVRARWFWQGGRRFGLALARDITERKRVEQALSESEERLREIASSLREAVWLRDVQSRQVLYVNPAFEEITGRTSQSFYDNRDILVESIHPDDKERVIRELEQRHENLPFQTEHRIVHMDGSVRWVMSQSFPVRNESGEVYRWASIMEDITRRKQAEEALRESEQRYRLLVSLSPDSIGIFDETGIVFVNPAAVEMMGASSESDLMGRSIYEFLDPDLHAMTKVLLEQMEVTGEPTTFVEQKFIRIDGSAFDAEVAGVPFRYQGRNAIQFVARDISEHKRHLREHKAIVVVSTALRRATTRAEILSVILDQSLELFEADGAVLVVANPQTGELTNEMGRGKVGQQLVGAGLSLDEGVTGWVVANRRHYLNNSADSDPLFDHPEVLGDSRCVACSPLIAKEQSIGALFVARKHTFTEPDMHLLDAIADIAANALHRVMLHEQTVQQLNHLIALHQIDLAISTQLDLHIKLDVILSNVKNELEVDAASILLLDPVSYTLDYAAGIGFRTTGIEHSHVRLGEEFSGVAAREYRTVSCPDLRQARKTFGRSLLLASEEFVSHFAAPLVVNGQVKGVLELFHRQTFAPDQGWMSYFETLATQAAIAIENASMFKNLQRSNLELTLAYDATIEGWSRALDLRDRETEGHTQRVTEMVLKLAEQMGTSEAEKVNIRRGALLHDIGKMGVPDSILFKAGPLSEHEAVIMQKHPTYAYQMLSPISYLKNALDIPYCHHEKWDGTGYPRGLKGEEIPLSARMFCIVDVFDALTSNRPYRESWTPEAAYRYIQEQAGKHFDPKLVEIFLRSRNL